MGFNDPDPIVGKGIQVFGVVCPNFELAAIVAVEAVFGACPEETLAVLSEGGDEILAEAVADVKHFGAELGLRRELQGEQLGEQEQRLAVCHPLISRFLRLRGGCKSVRSPAKVEKTKRGHALCTAALCFAER